MATLSVAFDVAPITPAVGGIVEGVDLSKPLDVETVRRLRQAGVQVRGMIFNQVGARVGSYGYGAYGYAYGYSSYAYKSRSGN